MQRLSFSQRSCVIFSKLTFHCPHLLILDEPTNFLDLESVDSLISACNKYKGALLLVSHNRDFLKKCAKHYLSVVPGQFELYDNLKAAERGTYTFIAEMEEGGRVGADALAKNPGGGTVHASQVNGGAAGSANPSEPKSISIGSNAKPISAVPPPGTAAAKPAAGAAPAAATGPVTYKVGDHCEAMWTDGKWYTASVKHVAGPKITVTYIEYGNTTTLSAVALRPLSAAAAAKLATKKAPAGKAPAAAGKAAAAAPKKK
jgi:energy-coupling factor transporter ATP-binding protein EcfA2